MMLINPSIEEMLALLPAEERDELTCAVGAAGAAAALDPDAEDGTA